MKTTVDFDTDEYKFQSKGSILELVFADTKAAIGYTEFDIGAYTNKIRGTSVKTVLDLKSDKFPGCQIYIYINIQLDDPLPAKESFGGAASIATRQTTIVDPNVGQSSKLDMNANKFEMEKKQMISDIKELDEQRIQVEIENERLKFQRDQALMEQYFDKQKLLQMKTQTKKGI